MDSWLAEIFGHKDLELEEYTNMAPEGSRYLSTWEDRIGDPRIKVGDHVRLCYHRKLPEHKTNSFNKEMEVLVGEVVEVVADHGHRRPSGVGYIEIRGGNKTFWWRRRDVILQKKEADSHGVPWGWKDDIQDTLENREADWAAMVPYLEAMDMYHFSQFFEKAFPNLNRTMVRPMSMKLLHSRQLEMNKPSLKPLMDRWRKEKMGNPREKEKAHSREMKLRDKEWKQVYPILDNLPKEVIYDICMHVTKDAQIDYTDKKKLFQRQPTKVLVTGLKERHFNFKSIKEPFFAWFDESNRFECFGNGCEDYKCKVHQACALLQELDRGETWNGVTMKASSIIEIAENTPTPVTFTSCRILSDVPIDENDPLLAGLSIINCTFELQPENKDCAWKGRAEQVGIKVVPPKDKPFMSAVHKTSPKSWRQFTLEGSLKDMELSPSYVNEPADKTAALLASLEREGIDPSSLSKDEMDILIQAEKTGGGLDHANMMAMAKAGKISADTMYKAYMGVAGDIMQKEIIKRELDRGPKPAYQEGLEYQNLRAAAVASGLPVSCNDEVDVGPIMGLPASRNFEKEQAKAINKAMRQYNSKVQKQILAQMDKYIEQQHFISMGCAAPLDKDACESIGKLANKEYGMPGCSIQEIMEIEDREFMRHCQDACKKISEEARVQRDVERVKPKLAARGFPTEPIPDPVPISDLIGVVLEGQKHPNTPNSHMTQGDKGGAVDQRVQRIEAVKARVNSPAGLREEIAELQAKLDKMEPKPVGTIGSPSFLNNWLKKPMGSF